MNKEVYERMPEWYKILKEAYDKEQLRKLKLKQMGVNENEKVN